MIAGGCPLPPPPTPAAGGGVRGGCWEVDSRDGWALWRRSGEGGKSAGIVGPSGPFVAILGVGKESSLRGGNPH